MSRKNNTDGFSRLRIVRGKNEIAETVSRSQEWYYRVSGSERRYPKVSEKHGAPLDVSWENNNCSVKEINDDFSPLSLEI